VPGKVCHISVAGNLDPEANLPRALELLRERAELTDLSTFYRTAAIGRPEQPAYLNGVARALFDGDARTLKFGVLRGIEAELGRVRGMDRYAARTVDLDLLLFGDDVVVDDGLAVPDPDLWRRPFLAACVLELEPDLVVPGTGLFLRELADMEAVARLEPAREFTRAALERLGL
jgi:dihydroneopterin aldolase/2-amino-4-hydroxy-6-hydroxymethyldihydropteridine diphosphokinase